MTIRLSTSLPILEGCLNVTCVQCENGKAISPIDSADPMLPQTRMLPQTSKTSTDVKVSLDFSIEISRILQKMSGLATRFFFCKKSNGCRVINQVFGGPWSLYCFTLFIILQILPIVLICISCISCILLYIFCVLLYISFDIFCKLNSSHNDLIAYWAYYVHFVHFGTYWYAFFLCIFILYFMRCAALAWWDTSLDESNSARA